MLILRLKNWIGIRIGPTCISIWNSSAIPSLWSVSAGMPALYFQSVVFIIKKLLCSTKLKWVASWAVFWCVFSLYFVKLIQLRESNLRSGPILATFILSFYMPCIRTFTKQNKNRTWSQVMQKLSWGQWDKEGGEGKKVENLCFARLYISYFTNYKQKTRQKTTCTFSIIMKMGNKKFHIYNPGQKSLGQYCNIHIFLSFLGSLLKQCILFEIFLQFTLPLSTFRFQACHMHALIHFSLIITCILTFFERL